MVIGTADLLHGDQERLIALMGPVFQSYVDAGSVLCAPEPARHEGLKIEAAANEIVQGYGDTATVMPNTARMSSGRQGRCGSGKRPGRPIPSDS